MPMFSYTIKSPSTHAHQESIYQESGLPMFLLHFWGKLGMHQFGDRWQEMSALREELQPEAPRGVTCVTREAGVVSR